MAQKRFTPTALPVAELQTVTLTDTWAAGDELLLTINRRTITLVVGTLATKAQIAIEAAIAWNDKTAALGAAYTASERGPNIPEFHEITATAAGDTIQLLCDTAGVTFTVSVDKDCAGDGDVSIATTTASTGLNHYNDDNNWTPVGVPVHNTDSILLADCSVDILYGLDQSAVTLLGYAQHMSYTGRIGLPPWNTKGYLEYRPLVLDFKCITTGRIGDGDGKGSSSTSLGIGSFAASTLNVVGTGTRADSAMPALQVTSGHASSVIEVDRGDVGIAVRPGTTATVGTLKVGSIANAQGDAKVYCGTGATLSAIVQSAGNLTTNSNLGVVTRTGGTHTHNAGTVTSITDTAGTTYYNGDTLGTADITEPATLDFRRSMHARTVTNTTIRNAGQIHDPAGAVTFTNPIACEETKPRSQDGRPLAVLNIGGSYEVERV